MQKKRMKRIGTLSAITLALAGGIILITGIYLSKISYIGIHGETYSFLNYFISELGWRKYAPSSQYFNWGLVVSCVFCMPLFCALGCHIRTRLGYAAMLCGISMLGAGAAVGLLPADNPTPHIIAALIFFWLYLFTMVLFTMAFAPPWNKTPSIPMMIAGIVCCVVAVAFLVFLSGDRDIHAAVKAIKGLGNFQRPQIWWLAILEWLIAVSGSLWAATSMIVLCRSQRAQEGT